MIFLLIVITFCSLYKNLRLKVNILSSLNAIWFQITHIFDALVANERNNLINLSDIRT